MKDTFYETGDEKKLRLAYAEHIQQFPWDFYITQTFRIPRRDPIYAARRFYDVIYTHFDCDRCFVAVEPHSTGDLHLHALTRHLVSTRPDVPPGMYKYLNKAFGRVSISGVSDAVAVTRYVAKYVTKSGYHYEYFGDRSAWVYDRY